MTAEKRVRELKALRRNHCLNGFSGESGKALTIESRVHVSEPKGDGEPPGGDTARTEGVKDVEEEEWEPTEDEAAHDQAQDQRRTLLLLPGNTTLLPLWITNFLLNINGRDLLPRPEIKPLPH